MEHKGRAIELQEEKDRWETERSELISQITIAQNTLNFLNSSTYQKLHDIGIKDRISIVLWAKKFIHKHHLMKTVQDRADEMVSQVNNFKQVFKELFEDCLPSFWDEEGRLFSQDHYHSLLV